MLSEEDKKMNKRIISHRWYYKHREIILKKQRQKYYKNLEYEKSRHKIYSQKPENKIKKNEYMKIRRKTSKIQIACDKKFSCYNYNKEWRNNYNKLKKINNKNFAIATRLRIRIREVVRKNLIKDVKIVPRKYKINYAAIIEYLKPFPENIKDYEIDHIIPLCSFDLTDEEQFKKATSPQNHQWLTILENRKKSNKILNNYQKGG